MADAHPRVRAAAADVLCAGPVEAVRAALLGALAAPDGAERPGQRAAVVRALGITEEHGGNGVSDVSEGAGAGPVHERLLEETHHGDADVRFHAFTALNRLGARDAAFVARVGEALGDPDAEVAAVAASAAAELGASEHLEAILERWRAAPRGFASRHLAIAAAHLGAEETVPALVKIVEGGVDAIEAIEALRDRDSAEVEPALRRFAKGWRVHPVVRARAAVALAERGAAGGMETVRACLGHRKRDMRHATLDFCARSGRPELVEPVIATLRDARHRDSAPAAYALGSCPLGAARDALVEACDDPRDEVAEEARLALAELGV